VDLPEPLKFDAGAFKVLALIEHMLVEIISQITIYISLHSGVNLRLLNRCIGSMDLENDFWRQQFVNSLPYLWRILFTRDRSQESEFDMRKVNWRQKYGDARNFLKGREKVSLPPDLATKKGLRINHIAKSLAKDLWEWELAISQKAV